MKNFCSPAEIQGSTEIELFNSLIGTIDPRFVYDKDRIIADIRHHEKLKAGKCAVFGKVFIHTARTLGISCLCMTAAIVKDRVEALVLWNSMSEHRIGKLADVVRILECVEKSDFSSREIIDKLKRI